MNLAQWKVAKDKSQAILKLLLYPFHDRIGLAARRAFIVAILDKGDIRILRALGVVFLVHGHFERCHLLSPPDQVLESGKNSVCAGIDGNRRKKAPGNDAMAVDEKKSAFRNAFSASVSPVLHRHRTLGLKV